MSDGNVTCAGAFVPRHYTLNIAAVLSPAAMLELVLVLDELDVDDEACGGLFAAMREQATEVYGTTDRPQPIVVPDAPPDDDEGGGSAAPVIAPLNTR